MPACSHACRKPRHARSSMDNLCSACGRCQGDPRRRKAFISQEPEQQRASSRPAVSGSETRTQPLYLYGHDVSSGALLTLPLTATCGLSDTRSPACKAREPTATDIKILIVAISRFSTHDLGAAAGHERNSSRLPNNSCDLYGTYRPRSATITSSSPSAA